MLLVDSIDHAPAHKITVTPLFYRSHLLVTGGRSPSHKNEFIASYPSLGSLDFIALTETRLIPENTSTTAPPSLLPNQAIETRSKLLKLPENYLN